VLSVWFFLVGIAWNCICFFSIPRGDQASVYQIAVSFSSGNYEAIAPTGYLACFPHQLGLIFIYELILRLTNWFKDFIPILDFAIAESPQTYLFIIRFVQLLSAVLCVNIGVKITNKIFHNNLVTFIYVIFMSLCFPFIMYISFIYGEIFSITASFLGIWILLKLIDAKRSILKLLYGVLLIMSSSIGTLVRMNTLIAVIGYVIVFTYVCIRQKKLLIILYSILYSFLLLWISAYILPQSIQTMYENKANHQLTEGVPSLAWIAMGLQDGNEGHNGFNVNTYLDTQYSTDETIRLSLESIKHSLNKFIKKPAYAFTFFSNKLKYEWTAGDFGIVYSTQTNYKPNPIFNRIYQPGLFQSLLFLWMTGFQLLIYLCVFCSILNNIMRKKTDKMEMLYFPIVIIGGFIFYLIWEGGERYIFPYFLMAIPAAADGLTTLTDFHLKSLKDRLQLHKKTVNE
jgi:hypothetical protein